MVDGETQEDMETLYPSDVADYRGWQQVVADWGDFYWKDIGDKEKYLKSRARKVQVDLNKRAKKLGKSKKVSKASPKKVSKASSKKKKDDSNQP